MTALNAYCRDCILFMQLHTVTIQSKFSSVLWAASSFLSIKFHPRDNEKSHWRHKRELEIQELLNTQSRKNYKNNRCLLGFKKSNSYKSFCVIWDCTFDLKPKGLVKIVQNLHSWLQFLELFWVCLSDSLGISYLTNNRYRKRE